MGGAAEGCSPSTSLRVRAAAAGGRWWECTRGRAAAGAPRAAGPRGRVARGGADALVAAPGNVAERGPRSPNSTRSQHSRPDRSGPRDSSASRLCSARAVPGVFSTRAESSPARRPAERRRRSSPLARLPEARDFGRRGRVVTRGGGRRGRLGDGEKRVSSSKPVREC